MWSSTPLTLKALMRIMMAIWFHQSHPHGAGRRLLRQSQLVGRDLRRGQGGRANDASNTARCYLMLQKIGWITLDPDVDPSSVTQDDIIENPYNIEFTEMKSLTIPAAIQDFDYVAITGSVVYNAGIDASTALANEDIMDHLVLQVVVKEENKDTDWAKAIVDAYHSDEFKQYMAENNDGLWWIPEELR